MDLTSEQLTELAKLARRMGGEPGIWVNTAIAVSLQEMGLARLSGRTGWMPTRRGLQALEAFRRRA